MSSKPTLIIINMQDDFCHPEEGTFAVHDGSLDLLNTKADKGHETVKHSSKHFDPSIVLRGLKATISSMGLTRIR